MTPRFARFSGLLVLCLVVACDGGADAKPKSSKAPASKAASAKAGGKKTPAKAKTREVAKATPASTDPAGASAVRPSGEPTSTPSGGSVTPSDPATPTAEAEPTTIDPATPTAEADPTAADPATPTAEADPTAIDPAADPAAEPTTPTEAEPGSPVTATGAELTTPIPLGPDAELLRLVLAHGMENRQPVDPATTFAEGTRVNLFIESRNEGEEPLSVRVTWENVKTGRRSPPTGVVIGKRKLHRTRAYRTMRKAGSFKAIVLDADDQELAVLPFTIE